MLKMRTKCYQVSWAATIVLILTSCCRKALCQAAAGTWTWMSGSNQTNQKGVYGTLGETSVDNIPGARSSHTMELDLSGECIFIFGGSGVDSSGVYGVLNDLWIFNTTSNLWTWISGSRLQRQRGVYGFMGEPSRNNIPGARYRHAMTIDSSEKTIFVFGGLGMDSTSTIDLLNDLWMFNLTSKIWTWIGGSNSRNQFGVYGTLRQPSSDVFPGSRYQHSLGIESSTRSIYVFAGVGLDSTQSLASVRINDLWMYNMTSHKWTWMSGSTLSGQRGNYVSLGQLSENNVPGARGEHAMVISPSGRFIFIFGGHGLDSTGTYGYLNDLWMFDLASSMWTWISGSKMKNQNGIYGVLGQTSFKDTIGARSQHSMTIDPSGRYCFVSAGYGSDSTGTMGILNDLWVYDLFSHLWIWIGGSNRTDEEGFYGIKGQSSLENVPGARYKHSTGIDPSGKFIYLFGGMNLVYEINDLWMLSLRNTTFNCISVHGCGTTTVSCQDSAKCMSLKPTLHSTTLDTNTRVRPNISRTNNFWIDNPLIASVIIFSTFVFCFEIGFYFGFQGKEKYTSTEYSESTSSSSFTNSSSSSAASSSISTGTSQSFHFNSSFHSHINMSTDVSRTCDSEKPTLMAPSETF